MTGAKSRFLPKPTIAEKTASTGWSVIFYGLLAAMAVLQIRYYLIPVRDFTWLTWLDGDIIWQVERFLLNLNFPGVEMLNSGAIDYGSELLWMVPLYRAINWIFPLTDPLSAYILLTLVHLAFGLGALLLVRRFFSLYQVSGVWAASLVLVVATSPLFAQYVSFVKPDPNVVLFFVCASIIGLFQYERTGRTRWVWLAVAAAGFGGAVKWWGGFMAFPLFYVFFRQRADMAMRWSVGRWGRIGIWVIIAASLAIFWFNPLFVKLAVYLKDQLVAGAGIGEPSAIKDRLLTGPWAGVSKLNWVSAGITAVCLVVGLAADFFWRKASIAVLRGAGGIGRAIWMLCAAFLLVVAAILVFDLPFLASDQMFGTIVYFGKYFLLTPQNLSAGGNHTGLVWNAWGWVVDSWQSGFLSPALIAAGIFAIWIHIRKVRRLEAGHLLNLIGLFLLPILIFLFFLVQKKNWATQAMLLPIVLAYMLVALMAWLRLLSGAKRGWAIAFFAALLIFQVGWQNRARFTPDVWTYYKSRDSLPAAVDDMNAQLVDIAGYAPVIGLCERTFPIDSNRPVKQIDCRHGVDPIGALKPGDVLVLNDEQAGTYGVFLDPAKVEEIGVVDGKRFSRDGRIEPDFQFRVYRVTEMRP